MYALMDWHFFFRIFFQARPHWTRIKNLFLLLLIDSIRRGAAFCLQIDC